jgi:hypothetical protein
VRTSPTASMINSYMGLLGIDLAGTAPGGRVVHYLYECTGPDVTHLRRRSSPHAARRAMLLVALGYQETGRALPSSYPAADWMPTRARSWNPLRSEAPA